MKKIIAILLTLSLVLCFAACGKDDQAKKDFARGVVTDGVYENEFIGVGADFSGDWTYFTDEQLAVLMGLTEDAVGAEFEDAFKNADIIYDMYVQNNSDASNVNINLEKLNAIALASTANMENYISSIMPSVQQGLENAGCTNVSYETMDVKIGDKTFEGAKMLSEIQGIKMYQVLVCIKCGDYLANISVATYNIDTTDDIVSKFYTIQ